MTPQVDALIQKLELTGKEIFWQGKASSNSIETLEGLLETKLPESYRRFLAEYGGGGLIGEEISGIEDDDATLEYRGTILGDTIECRNDFDLPSHLLVIFLGGDDVIWCFDTKAGMESEFPVVSFDANTKEILPLFKGFEEFLTEYLTLRIERE